MISANRRIIPMNFLVPLEKQIKSFARIVSRKYIGSVDELSLTRAAGWAIAGDGSSPAKVAVLVAGQVVAIATADRIRKDVKAGGFSTEICGFEIELDLAPRDLFGNNVKIVHWVRDASSRELKIPTEARPWALGFWNEEQQPFAARWRPIAQRIKLERDLLPVEQQDPDKARFLLEGPVKGDYSIAIVNRSFAKSILSAGHNVTLVSDDKQLDGDAIFNAEKSLVERYDSSAKSEEFEIHSLNTWPPETGHMKAKVRALHCYAWEESSFPPNFLNNFNKNLDLVGVTSRFTKVALENSGLTVPTVLTGNGIDEDLFRLRRQKRGAGGRFRFLHISSCFARKGVDKLIQAFVEEFEHDSVELYIKSFDNPHNNVREIVASYGDRAKNISVNLANLSPAAIRKLYTKADCLVAPSRGEGFLLPAAEAMAVGLPVITTDVGGQSDFCDSTTAWLVKSTAVASGTHMSLNDSYWYEPDLMSLRQQMRAVFKASKAEINFKARPAREVVRNTYAWDKVAARYLNALSTLTKKQSHRPKLALITTWNQSCGIATYSQELYPSLARKFDASVISELTSARLAVDEDFVSRRWSRRRDSMAPLADAVIDGGYDAVLIQHHPSHFSWSDLGHLIDCIVQGSQNRIKIFCQLHSTAGQAEAIRANRLSFARTDAILVHTINDVETLGVVAADTRVAVVPHGIPTLPSGRVMQKKIGAEFHIGSFGFCMPHKGIKNHLRSLALLRERIPKLRATLLHAVNDDDKTVAHALEVIELIKRLSLENIVEIDFRFLSKHEVESRLRECDLIVLPYENNFESASGAIRDVLGTGAPLLTTAVSTFSDVSEFVFQTKSNHPIELAREIMKLYSNPAFRASKLRKQMEHVDAHSWDKVASRIANVMLSTF